IDSIPDGWPTGPLTETHRELLAYFQARRFGLQLQYFEALARENRQFDEFTNRLPPALFVLSITAAFAHFLFDALTKGAVGVPEPTLAAAPVLILLAAALPVVGTGIRTIRMANEFARNTIRYQAGRSALTNLIAGLSQDTLARELFLDLWRAEQYLAAEHREWL